jgi:hypothetical protein
MEEALKAQVVPALRARGFRGSLPHFRRAGTDRIDLLTIQFDRHGGGFVVEIATCPPSGVTTAWGEQVPPQRVTAHDVHPHARHRLGAPKPGEDGRWFRYDDGKSTEDVAAAVVVQLAEADAWWDAAG